MRTREYSLHLRMTQAEMSLLRKQASKAGLKPQAYILALLKDKPVKELPQMEFYGVLKVLRQISLNMNQIAVKANAIGFVDTAEYWKNVDAVQAAISEIKEAVRN